MAQTVLVCATFFQNLVQNIPISQVLGALIHETTTQIQATMGAYTRGAPIHEGRLCTELYSTTLVDVYRGRDGQVPDSGLNLGLDYEGRGFGENMQIFDQQFRKIAKKICQCQKWLKKRPKLTFEGEN